MASKGIDSKELIKLYIEKETIKLCIETYSPDEASERITEYIRSTLELKEQQIKLEYSLNQKT